MQPLDKMMDAEHKAILQSMDKAMIARILKNLRYRKGRLVCKHDKHNICKQCLDDVYNDANRAWNPDVAGQLKRTLETGEGI